MDINQGKQHMSKTGSASKCLFALNGKCGGCSPLRDGESEFCFKRRCLMNVGFIH